MSASTPTLGVPLSVLDTAPVVRGTTPATALQHALELAQLADRSGYHRIWYAEHHNMPGIASSAPEILIATVAATTGRIRVGSGGVMLPNHAPLMVAERFGTLEALHPGRIDLGIGRAPGSDQLTARALRRQLGNPELPELLAELEGYFEAAEAGSTAAPVIRATPGQGYRPAIWLLGSSGYSAQLAGERGLPFATAHHFSAAASVPSIAHYRDWFQPSDITEEPYALLTVQVIVAETEERARRIGDAFALLFLRMRQGVRPDVLLTQDEVDAYPWTVEERAFADQLVAQQAVGTPDQVRARLAELVATTGASEVMATAMAPSHEDRLRSFELLAELGGLTGQSVVGD